VGKNGSSQPTKPNIIMVICHDLGRHLGCYGVGDISTPHLDALAREGLRFDNYFCTAPQCSPSRGSIMTGMYPHENGLMGLAHLGWEIDRGYTKLPEALRDAGYDTHLFGIQHETGQDPEWLGYEHVHRTGGKAAEVAPQFIDFLKSKDPDSGERFYASVGFLEPHRPYAAPGYEADDPQNVSPLPYLPDDYRIRKEIGQLQGLIKAVDTEAGKILRALQETGLEKNTLFIFTTDHGIAFPRAKGMLYDPGVGTVLIMRWPGVINAGQVCSHLLSNVDLMPTLLEIAGACVPDGISGRSFLPLILNQPYEEREDIFVELTWHDRYNPMRAVRTRRYKYIRSFGRRPLVYIPADIYVAPSGEAVRDEYYSKQRPAEELYDLVEDPLEQRNLIGKPDVVEVEARLRTRLQDWMEETGDPLLAGPVPGRKENDRPDLREIPDEPVC